MTIDAKILSALRGAGEGSVSGADLSHSLKISRAAVWARIEEMRVLGYDIEASPHHGYRLVSTPDLLHADDLLSRLPAGALIGRDIQVFKQTTSTNDLVERLAREGVDEGIVVFAESQSRGRGRLGRKWISTTGKGLWFSILLRPVLRPQAATQVTVLAATAIARAIESHTHLEPSVKWPNDLLIKGKKVSGILTELNSDLDSVKYMVVGIGVNVNQSAADFPSELRKISTSLKMETGRQIQRAELAVAMLREFDQAYDTLKKGRFLDLANQWEQRCSTLGQEVTVQVGARFVSGRAESIDEEGALLIRTEHGLVERIVGGDVTFQTGNR